jgi:hypothetical protein
MPEMERLSAAERGRATAPSEMERLAVVESAGATTL